MKTPLCRVRDVTFYRVGPCVELRAESGDWIQIVDGRLMTGLHGLPLSTWSWLLHLVVSVLDYATVHHGRMPEDGILVRLVLRAAHLNRIPCSEVADHRPDPGITLDEES